MTKTTAAITAAIFEAVGNYPGKWLKLADIAKEAELTPEELQQGMEELMGMQGIYIDPEPITWRVTTEDKLYAVRIGGDMAHRFMWR